MQRTFLARAAVFVLPLVVFFLFAYNIWQDLDSNNYSLTVSESSIVEWMLLSIMVGGLATLLRELAPWLRQSQSASQTLRMLPDVPLRASLRLRSRRLAPVCVEMPNFGMYCGWTLNILMFIFMIFLTPRVPMGLMVRLPSRYIAALPRAPESESLGVYIGPSGQLYVNGQLVQRERLRAKLQDELSRRVLWIIYFEADNDAAYGQVVYAIDTIRGIGAEPHWVTPHVRAALTPSAPVAQRQPAVSELFKGLQSRQASGQAAAKLLELGNADAQARRYLADHLPSLIEADPRDPRPQWHPIMRLEWYNAVQLAAELKLAEAAPALAKWISFRTDMGVTGLSHDASLESRPAGKALVQIGDPAIPTLRRLLANGNIDERWEAAYALILIDSFEAKEVLHEYAVNGRDQALADFIKQYLSRK